MKFRKILKYAAIGVFLYTGFISIQNFYQGYHSLDLAFNMLNQGLKADIGTNGQLNNLGLVYLNGVKMITSSFVWLCLDCILGVYIGMLYKEGVKK